MIPEATIGDYSIEHTNGTQLNWKCKTLCASDCVRYLYSVLEQLEGDVLLGGLGVGWLAEHAALKDSVTSITVVEIAQEVIDLVWKHINLKGKGKIVHSDIWDYHGKHDIAHIDIPKLDQGKIKEHFKNILKVLVYSN